MSVAGNRNGHRTVGRPNGTKTRRDPSGASIIATFRAAVVALEHDNPTTAVRLLDQVLRQVPHNPDALCLRGIAANRLDDYATAIRYLRTGTANIGPINSETRDAYNEYALALRYNDDLDKAEQILRDILDAEPEFGAAWHNLALLLQSRESIDEAVFAARRSVATRPNDPGALLLLGKLLRSQGRLLTARSVLRRAEALAPEDVSINTTLGNTYFYLGEIDAALCCFRRAAELHPDAPVFHSNYATMLTHCRRYDEARVAHDKAFALAPDNPDIVVRRAAFLLNTTDLATGWAAYNARLDAQPKARQWTGTPNWTGTSLHGQHLCVYREQGIGDEIMFASCYDELIAAAKHVTIECDARLHSLFQRSFPEADVQVQTDAGSFDATNKHAIPPAHPMADLAIPAGSTLEFLRPTVDSFPSREHFLEADPGQIAQWRQRLTHDVGPGPYVGISWRSMIRTAERRLEYTRLDEWGPILRQAAAGALQFVLLQYDQCEREVADAEQRFGIRIHRWRDLDLMNDFDGVAALTCALDAVIAPRNAVAMLSAAVGTPTLALGNVGDWAECGTTQLPWFDSLECLNRNVDGDWSAVIAETSARLHRLCTGTSVLNNCSQRKATV